jgi:hypothetical protein
MTQPAPSTGVPLSYQPQSAPPTSPVLVLLAWLVVGIPAAWGVEQTVMKSLALFRNTPPAAQTPTTPTRVPITSPSTAPSTAPAAGPSSTDG